MQGAFVIAMISSFFIISNLLLKASGLSDIGWNWELLFLIIDSAVVLSLFYGIVAEKAALLQPFVVLNVLTISFLILLSIFFISAIYDSHSYAAEYVELAISDRMQHIVSIISVPQQNGLFFNFDVIIAISTEQK
uniref:MARVEL domain-containing protein n=1 Tax=Elaeophora elaphi TaxID=1147741 RepID=A0A0R3S544_9BILA